MISSIDNLIVGYQERKFSPTEITEWYLKRIKKLNPQLNAFITITEDTARQQAKSAEDKMTSDIVKELLGVPISFKDSIDTKGILTSNGSHLDAERYPKEDAEIVKLLEREETVLLGKTNMYEYGAGITSENTNFGDIVNPLNPKKTAGGSSGGSAVAVASNLCLGSVGTDASGSIRVPAACCGVVGIKPTYDLISTRGTTHLSWTLDHTGVIANSVKDTAIMLQAVTRNVYVQDNSFKLTGVKIGIPTHYFNEDSEIEVRKAYEKTIHQIRKLGAQIVEVDTSFLSDVVKVSRTIGTSEMGVVHMERIAENPQLYSKELQQTFERSKGISAMDYIGALQKREEWKQKVSQIFSIVDVMMTPVMPIIPPGVEMNEKAFGNETLGDCMVRYTNVFNLTGHPALSLPTDTIVHGIPISVQLVAGHHQEVNLFRVGRAYEQYILA
ncbi:amidase [Sporosarcina sp. FSL W7-1283]|uniref:amidase n=1 Tax=Sporosarcina sp. FSL W7-1283 TaxID=2921560 RepID=UPI0030FA494E